MYIARPSNYNRTYLTGEVITLACKKGFQEQAGGNPVRVCIHGRWTQFPFKCKGIHELLIELLKNVYSTYYLFLSVISKELISPDGVLF